MMTDVFKALSNQLNQWATGFPETRSHDEMKVLKTLFTKQEAALFLKMTPFPETVAGAASRLGMDEQDLAYDLEAMAKKGLLFRLREKGELMYCSLSFLPGILEFQQKNVKQNRDMAKYLALYGINGFLKSMNSLSTPHQRPLPVDTRLVGNGSVDFYDDAVAIVKNQDRIAMTDCICRSIVRQVTSDYCGNPLEICMVFGFGADYFIENGWAREITVNEALSVLKKCDEQAMVVQVRNSKKPGSMCACCGDCCGLINSLKMQENPAEASKSNYYCVINHRACVGCGVCVERCQIDAMGLSGDKARLNLERCLGCGLCVTSCASQALALHKKEGDQLYDPPEDYIDMQMQMGRERGMM